MAAPVVGEFERWMADLFCDNFSCRLQRKRGWRREWLLRRLLLRQCLLIRPEERPPSLLLLDPPPSAAAEFVGVDLDVEVRGGADELGLGTRACVIVEVLSTVVAAF